MKANAECTKCGCRWYLKPSETDVQCDRKLGRTLCDGQVVRDETREILKNLDKGFVTYQ